MSAARTVVILAAGKGTRMKSARPKVMHALCGRPLISWVVEQAFSLDPERVIVVVGHGADEVREHLADHPEAARLRFVVQEPQRGTGHALQVCGDELGEDPGLVIVLYGDMPLLTGETVAELAAARETAGEDAMAILTTIMDEPHGYGRIVRDEHGAFAEIVEEADCSEEQRSIVEVNTGVYVFGGRELLDCLPRLDDSNAQGEVYLTDVAAMFVADGRAVATLPLADHEEGVGINTLAQLAEARWTLQVRILEEHLANGVEIEDPATTYINHGVEIGAGTRVLPCTVIRSGVRIGAGCEVGPFTHLRAGTVLEDGAEVGNFTECKNSTVGRGAKAKHLSYLGDASIGAGANIGAGTIFANYDGRAKHRTEVGEGAFVGSGTIIVAPNTIGPGATTGAGAVVTRGAQVGPGEVWVGVPARPIGARGSETVSSEDASESD
jgi:bifunctional UDP-N-acetylglucosamine pyrophosphorylase/glucosamine-1-phosphate N-acetyltransferase